MKLSLPERKKELSNHTNDGWGLPAGVRRPSFWRMEEEGKTARGGGENTQEAFGPVVEGGTFWGRYSESIQRFGGGGGKMQAPGESAKSWDCCGV